MIVKQKHEEEGKKNLFPQSSNHFIEDEKERILFEKGSFKLLLAKKNNEQGKQNLIYQKKNYFIEDQDEEMVCIKFSKEEQEGKAKSGLKSVLNVFFRNY